MEASFLSAFMFMRNIIPLSVAVFFRFLISFMVKDNLETCKQESGKFFDSTDWICYIPDNSMQKKLMWVFI